MPRRAHSAYETPRGRPRSRRVGRLGSALLLVLWSADLSRADLAATETSGVAEAVEGISARLQRLEARVAVLQDVEEIRSLRQRYHESVNEGRTAQIAELFAERGVVDFGDLGSRLGREAIHQFFAEELINEKLTFIKQFNHNHSVEVSGDRATGSSYLEAKNVLSGAATMVAARYDDTYVRTTEGWRFEKMKLTLYFVVPFERGWGNAARSGEAR